MKQGKQLVSLIVLAGSPLRSINRQFDFLSHFIEEEEEETPNVMSRCHLPFHSFP